MLVVLLALTIGATGAVTMTSRADAAPTAPTIVVGSLFGTTDGTTTVNAIVQDGLDQTVSVWFLRPGVTDPIERELFCTFTVAAADANSGSCGAAFPAGEIGEYTLFATADDGTGESPPSELRSFPVGESASTVPVTVGGDLGTGAQQVLDTPTVTVSGTAPAMSRVEVTATSVAPVVTETVCVVTQVPVSGLYECSGSLPAPTYGQWTIGVQARDVAATPVTVTASGGPFTVVIAPPNPLVDASVGPGSASFTVQGLPDASVGAELLLNGFGTPTSAGYCPSDWSGSPLTPPTGGAIIVCDFGTLPAGIHILESGQFLNGTATLGREDAVFVPSAPALDVEPIPGGVIVSGTVDPSTDLLAATGSIVSALQVYVTPAGSPDQVICVDVADPLTGAWSCATGFSPGVVAFTAHTRSIGFADNVDAPGGVDGYLDGVSGQSPPIETVIPDPITPPAPTMDYGFGPASIDVRASGLPNSAVSIDIYRVDINPEGGYSYGSPVQSCGLVQLDEEASGLATGPSTVTDCLLTNLEPGIWNIYANQRLAFQSGPWVDHYVLIPPTPTISAASASMAGEIAVSGRGEPGNQVTVRQVGGSASCSASVASTGAWACTIPGASGELLLRAQQRAQGFVAEPLTYYGEVASFNGISALTAPIAVSVPTAPTTPSATGPLRWSLLGYDGSPLRPGQTLDLSATGLPPQTDIAIEIRSTPQVLGTTAADALGGFQLTVTIPETIEPGVHTLVATATPPGGLPAAIEVPVTVVSADTDGVDTPVPATATPLGAAQGDAGGTRGDRANPAAPSAITDSVPTLQRLFNEPWAFVASGGLALALLLLVAFPAELLNNTLASNTGRLGRWFVALERRTEQVTDWATRVAHTRALAAALLVTLTALIFGFVDPEYGFDPVSVRMTVSLAIGLFLITYVSAWISGAIAARVWGLQTQVALQPVALLFAVVGVVLARLLDFSPGFLIGLVIGLDLLSRVDVALRARVVVLSTATTAGIAVTAWFAFSALALGAGTDPGWVEQLIGDALVATTAEGLTAALASLLPLGFLAGHDVFRYSKRLWGGTFVVIAALFALIVLPTATGETNDITDVGFWMLVMVSFAVVTLTLWAVLQFTGRSVDDAESRAEPVGSGSER